MSRSRKRIRYLDYPLFPTRRRPWGRLILGGVVLGLLAFLAWGWLSPTLLAPERSSPVADAVPTPGGGQVVLVRSEVVTPTATLRPDLTLPPEVSYDDLIDEVDEVEISWTEHEGREEMVTALLEAGADASLRDAVGQTPSDVAVARNHQEVADIIRDHAGGS